MKDNFQKWLHSFHLSNEEACFFKINEEEEENVRVQVFHLSLLHFMFVASYNMLNNRIYKKKHGERKEDKNECTQINVYKVIR